MDEFLEMLKSLLALSQDQIQETKEDIKQHILDRKPTEELRHKTALLKTQRIAQTTLKAAIRTYEKVKELKNENR